MSNVVVRTQGFEALREALKEMPNQAMRAARRANRKAAEYGRSQYAKHMAERTGIAFGVFNQKRAMAYFASPMETEGTAKTWFGYNVLKPSVAGKIREDVSGVWAGSYYFADAFLIRFASGEGIFKREAGRLVKQMIELPMAAEYAEPVAILATDRLQTLLEQELRYERLKNG